MSKSYVSDEVARELNSVNSGLSDVMRKQKRNSREFLFAQKYQQLIAETFECEFTSDWKKTGRWLYREGKNTESVSVLLSLGLVEAIYGRGRSILK